MPLEPLDIEAIVNLSLIGFSFGGTKRHERDKYFFNFSISILASVSKLIEHGPPNNTNASLSTAIASDPLTMTKADKKLDNPVWHSLTETHQDFAIQYDDLKFYHPDYCPFGGFVNID